MIHDYRSLYNIQHVEYMYEILSSIVQKYSNDGNTGDYILNLPAKSESYVTAKNFVNMHTLGDFIA